MNQIIIFCAANLIYISVFYVLIKVIFKRDKKDYLIKILIVLISGVVAWVVAHILKGVIAHPRPDLTNSLITPDATYSFPSGHATFMFALAFAMYHFDKYAGKIIFILAVLTGISRVLAGVHFWYDIFGGFILGSVVSFLLLQIVKRLIRKTSVQVLIP